MDNKQRYAWCHGSRRDAEDKLAQLLVAASTGTLADPSQATVASYVRETLDVARDLAPKTLERYRELAERQVIPHLGDIKLQKLRPEHVEKWHATLLDTGLAARTIGHSHRLLHKVLVRATRSGVLVRNPAALVSPPRPEDREIEILEPAQLKTVLESLRGCYLHPIAALAAASGMRRGELCALTWQAVDLDHAVVEVRQSLEQTRGGRLRLKAPKTAKGRRTVTLPADAVETLRVHKLEQMQLRMQLGQGKIEPGTFVFSTIEDRPLSPDNLSRDWRRVCTSKGLPRVSFHSLRHFHASALLASGVDILAVSRRLGHSRASTTLDRYGHALKGGDEAAAKAIQEVLK